MELSLAAWLGALAGMICAAFVHVAVIRALEAWLRGARGQRTPQQRAEFEAKLSALRRSILAVEVAVLAALGYWLGGLLGGVPHARF